MSAGLFAAFALFNLWDYYIPPFGRVMDYAGLAVLAAISLPQIFAGAITRKTTPPSTLLLAASVAPFVFLGLLQGEYVTAAAFTIGLTLVHFTYWNIPINGDLLHRQLGWVLRVSLFFFFLQYLAHLIAGIVLDYHSWIGSVSPRIYNLSTGFFRAAGLFEEPNSYSLGTFLMLSLRGARREPRDWIYWLGVLSVLLSESLWGFGAVLVLTAYKLRLFQLTFRNIAALIAMGAVAAAGIIWLLASSDLLRLVFTETTVRRLTNVGQDTSVSERYGSLGSSIDLPIFGHGLSTDLFQSYSGANGWGFYIYCFGLLSSAIFVAYILWSSEEDRLARLLIILFAMASYPLFTYMIWWAWLALFLRATEKGNAMLPSPGSVLRLGPPLAPAGANPFWF